MILVPSMIARTGYVYWVSLFLGREALGLEILAPRRHLADALTQNAGFALHASSSTRRSVGNSAFKTCIGSAGSNPVSVERSSGPYALIERILAVLQGTADPASGRPPGL